MLCYSKVSKLNQMAYYRGDCMGGCLGDGGAIVEPLQSRSQSCAQSCLQSRCRAVVEPFVRTIVWAIVESWQSRLQKQCRAVVEPLQRRCRAVTEPSSSQAQILNIAGSGRQQSHGRSRKAVENCQVRAAQIHQKATKKTKTIVRKGQKSAASQARGA